MGLDSRLRGNDGRRGEAPPRPYISRLAGRGSQDSCARRGLGGDSRFEISDFRDAGTDFRAVRPDEAREKKGEEGRIQTPGARALAAIRDSRFQISETQEPISER